MKLREFATTDKTFITACEEAGLPKKHILKCGKKTSNVDHSSLGLTRQASKWLQGKGIAYKTRRV